MVKKGEAKQPKLSKKRYFCGNRGNCINFAEIEGKFIIFLEIWENMQYASLT